VTSRDHIFEVMILNEGQSLGFNNLGFHRSFIRRMKLKLLCLCQTNWPFSIKI